MECPLKELGYCERINRKVPPVFCMACQGDEEQIHKWKREDILEWRKKHTSPLTEEQLADKDMVSVIMPAKDCERPYIQRTIDNLRETAVGPIEIIVACDGWAGKYGDFTICNTKCKGQRVICNKAVRYARGKYIFRLDPHCAMSDGWDARMKSSCGEKDLIIPVYDGLDIDTWGPTGRDTAFWYLDSDLKCTSVRPWKPVQDRKIEEPAMSMSGGAWMVRKDRYDELGGHDEWLGKHGAIGPEWSLKIWLTGGEVLIRTDVVCSHLWRKKSPYGYNLPEREAAFAQLRKMWIDGEDKRRTRPMEWLLYKFNGYVKYKPTATVRIK